MLDATRCRLEDSSFFRVTIKVLRAFIDPDHHLILIDEKFAFPRLAEPLEDCYRRGNSRQGIQLEGGNLKECVNGSDGVTFLRTKRA